MAERRPEALKAGILAMTAAGMTVQQMAWALGMARKTLLEHRHRLGLLEVRAMPEPDAGPEVWLDVPGMRARLSTHHRVMSAAGKILNPVVRGNGQRVFSLIRENGQATTATLDALRSRVGLERLIKQTGEWTAQDDAVLYTSKNIREALARLPGRNLDTVKDRKKRLGIVYQGSSAGRGTVRSERQIARDLYREALAVIPASTPPDVREDLAADIVLLLHEGFRGTVADAFKAARKARNYLTGAFKERSLDAPLPGFDDLTLLDTMTTEHERF